MKESEILISLSWEAHPSESRVLWRLLKTKAATGMNDWIYVDIQQVAEDTGMEVNIWCIVPGRSYIGPSLV